jgi:hypothetical protein
VLSVFGGDAGGMTLTPLFLTRRIAAVLALAAIAATFLLAGVAAAKTTYPSAVRKAFLSTCVKAALKSEGSVSKADATAYCQAALVCIEGKLSLSQFAKVSTSDPVITKCEKSAAKQVFS